MATILIKFQQKFTLGKRFQHFAIKFLNQKILRTLEEYASKSSFSWQGKCNVFKSIDVSQSIQATLRVKMMLPNSQSVRCTSKNNFLPLASILLGSAS